MDQRGNRWDELKATALDIADWVFGHNPDCALAQQAATSCDAQDCLAHGDAGRVGPCMRDAVTPVAPDAARRSVHGTATAADVAAGRCDCGSRGGPCAPRR